MSDTTPLPPSPQVAPSPQLGAAPPSEGAHSTILKIQHGISTTRNYTTMVIEEVIKPSIKTFLETCDTNPRVAAIVATPALLAFFVVATFFVLSASALILWSILTISVGMIFVVVGGLISLTFKLLIVLLATIPLAGMATGLLVAANAASKIIIDKLPKGNPENVSKTLKEIDWKTIVDGTTTLGTYAIQGVKEAAPALLAMRDMLFTLAVAAHSAFDTARVALNNQQISSANDSNSGKGVTAVEPIESGEEMGVLIDNQEESHNLKRRTPFSNAANDVEPQK
ncbi:hypothetical protein BJ912DRAFT_481374 [Pholiota molesta]|nr:hypothetical protein BJ912DRAFT_481374 [Pholiota molesta]